MWSYIFPLIIYPNHNRFYYLFTVEFNTPFIRYRFRVNMSNVYQLTYLFQFLRFFLSLLSLLKFYFFELSISHVSLVKKQNVFLSDTLIKWSDELDCACRRMDDFCDTWSHIYQFVSTTLVKLREIDLSKCIIYTLID